MRSSKPRFPRVPLPRQTGGAHRVRRELSAREDLTLRLNELEAEGPLVTAELLALVPDEDSEDYFDYLIERLDMEAHS